MKNLNTFLNQHTKQVDWSKNEYNPANGVNDAIRKQFFTTYDEKLMSRIRDIKLNQVNK